MNTLRAQRANLEAALHAGGITVLDHLPERISPPLAIIAAGSPYIEPGETFGSYATRFTVVLVAPHGTNQTVTHVMDQLLTTSLVVLDDHDWRLERVDTPVMLSHGGAQFLSVQIDLAAPVTGIDDGGDG